MEMYKMSVSFKLKNTDFPPLPPATVSNPVFSVSALLLFTTASKTFSNNISFL